MAESPTRPKCERRVGLCLSALRAHTGVNPPTKGLTVVTISRLLRPFTRRARPTVEAAPVAEAAPVTETAPVAETAPAAEAAFAAAPVTEAPVAGAQQAEPVSASPEPSQVDVAPVVEATIVEYSVPVLVQRPVDLDTSRAEEALYALVTERVQGMVGPGGTFTVSMRTSDEDDRFFSQAFAQLIARELVSQLHASSRQVPAELTRPAAGAIGTGRSSRSVHAVSHESRLSA